ncbi:response regulator [Pedobacter glucosidilyticus]|uniref:response regulator n=1 Tax=Pedobacter glucosidilyticus TaxID=1122941 RepID=UPI0026EE7791|nr:response regulator [Pedobacter glucosidilyticus]
MSKENISNAIWIVEDDPDDRLMLKEAFKEFNYIKPLVFFEDGEKIIEILKKKRHKPRPNLILLDLNMPKINGRQVLAFIKEHEKTKNIPVVIFTTSRSEQEKTDSLKMGASDFITKPYKFNEMLKIAGDLIKSYG